MLIKTICMYHRIFKNYMKKFVPSELMSETMHEAPREYENSSIFSGNYV